MPNTVSQKYYVKLVNVYYQMVRKTQIVLNNIFQLNSVQLLYQNIIQQSCLKKFLRLKTRSKINFVLKNNYLTEK